MRTSEVTKRPVVTMAGEAIAQARRQPGQISTLILPADCAWTDLPEGTQARKVAPLAAALTDSDHVKTIDVPRIGVGKGYGGAYIAALSPGNSAKFEDLTVISPY